LFIVQGFFDDKQLSLLRDIVSLSSKRVSSLLPKTNEEFGQFIKHLDEIYSTKQNNGSKQIQAKDFAKRTLGDLDKTFATKPIVSTTSLTAELAKRTLDKRDIKWIEENGICLENIRPGLSSIKGAGWGAFANIDIQNGTIITPAPLLNIPNRDSLLIYNTFVNESGERVQVENSSPIGHQLLLNYCFGHDKSQLLFCPSTNVILINHCSKRAGNICNGGKGPNAKIQWAKSGWDSTTDDWLNKTVEEIVELTQKGARGLSLEIVATSSIHMDEEVSS
jgi:hypothetical protein